MINPWFNSAVLLAGLLFGSAKAADSVSMSHEAFLTDAAALQSVSTVENWIDMACRPCHYPGENEDMLLFTAQFERDCDLIVALAGISDSAAMPPDEFWRTLYRRKLENLAATEQGCTIPPRATSATDQSPPATAP